MDVRPGGQASVFGLTMFKHSVASALLKHSPRARITNDLLYRLRPIFHCDLFWSTLSTQPRKTSHADEQFPPLPVSPEVIGLHEPSTQYLISSSAAVFILYSTILRSYAYPQYELREGKCDSKGLGGGRTYVKGR